MSEIIKCSYRIYDNFIEITPESKFVDNSTYEIKIKNVKSLSKAKKLDVLNLKFVSKLTPAYCTVDGIETLIEVFDIPEARLLYYIREASRYADYINKKSAGTEDSVSFQVEQFVKIKATLDALLRAYIDIASSGSSKGTLGDVSYEQDGRAEGIKDLIKKLKEELKQWEYAVRGYFNEGRAKPLTTIKGFKQSTNSQITPTTAQMILNDFTRTMKVE